MIKSNYSVKILKVIFSKIVNQLKKTLYDKSGDLHSVSMSGGSYNNSNGKSDGKGARHSYELVKTSVFLL